MSTKSCCAPGCPRKTPMIVLFCRTHWGMVPVPLQRDVMRTWRAYLAAHGRERLNAFAAYQAARGTAIEVVSREMGRGAV